VRCTPLAFQAPHFTNHIPLTSNGLTWQNILKTANWLGFCSQEAKEDTIFKQGGLHMWENMVYSDIKRSLTFEQNKLIALSCVARRLQPYIILQSDNLVGLWRSFYLPRATNVPSRTAAYCAPSWSWASVSPSVPRDILVNNLAVYTLPQGKLYMIQIHKSHIFLKTDDTMGQVSGGSLTLRG
jgi:hypothetical protein